MKIRLSKAEQNGRIEKYEKILSELKAVKEQCDWKEETVSNSFFNK